MLVLDVLGLFVDGEDEFLSAYEAELGLVDLEALVEVELDHGLVDHRLVVLVDLKGQSEYAPLADLQVHICAHVLFVVGELLLLHVQEHAEIGRRKLHVLDGLEEAALLSLEQRDFLLGSLCALFELEVVLQQLGLALLDAELCALHLLPLHLLKLSQLLLLAVLSLFKLFFERHDLLSKLQGQLLVNKLLLFDLELELLYCLLEG